MKFLNNFFKSSKEKQEPNIETYVDIVISLNKNYEIDFSVLIDDRLDSIPISPEEYAALCGTFMNVSLSNKMKIDTVDILNNQIKNDQNKKLVDNIVALITLNNDKNIASNNNAYIKPSEVFAKHSI
jgi:hypothetical protein